MRSEERREKREERREERGEKQKREEVRERTGPKSPDWFHAWGDKMIAVYVSRVCIRVRGSYQVS